MLMGALMSVPQIAELLSYLDSQPEPRIVMDKDYTIIAANTAYRAEYGDARPLVGRHCYEVSHHFTRPCDQAGESCPLKHSRLTGRPQRVLHLHHTPRGEEHVDVELAPIHDASGEIVYFVEMMHTVRGPVRTLLRAAWWDVRRHLTTCWDWSGGWRRPRRPCLLLGESGTGKELVAQAVHDASRRASGPYVAVDCSGVTETLFESELFGYEKGAFTGAAQRKPGLVESASGGTLFLDEVGDIPLGLQVKLLRLLETGTYRRVGGIEPLRADFRLVSATHRDLKKMVEQESFRKDLYYRISTFPIHLPALSERREDIPSAGNHAVGAYQPGAQAQSAPGYAGATRAYDFPGNIRELRNMLERASLMADGDTIMPEHLDPECTGFQLRERADAADHRAAGTSRAALFAVGAGATRG